MYLATNRAKVQTLNNIIFSKLNQMRSLINKLQISQTRGLLNLSTAHYHKL